MLFQHVTDVGNLKLVLGNVRVLDATWCLLCASRVSRMIAAYAAVTIVLRSIQNNEVLSQGIDACAGANTNERSHSGVMEGPNWIKANKDGRQLRGSKIRKP